MNKRVIIVLIVLIASSCSKKNAQSFVLVKGGNFSNFYGKKAVIPDFYVGTYEVTQKEWEDVMGSNPSKFKGNNLPMEMVSWYDCIVYCNKRSLREGLTPYYTIDSINKDRYNKSPFDSIRWTVTIDTVANGYRLPTETEWQYAADGGRQTKGYVYSGSDHIDKVAWYRNNSANITRPVGSKAPNELGLYDMSGNVREWCFDWYIDWDAGDSYKRIVRGGGWLSDEKYCTTSFRGEFDASGKGPDQGFRICYNK